MRAISAQWSRHTWASLPCGGKLLDSAVFIGMLTSLALSGCAATSRTTQTPGTPVDHVGQIRLAWEAPTTRADGTPLVNITGFRLYYGLTSGMYAFMKTVGSQPTAAVSGLEPG